MTRGGFLARVFAAPLAALGLRFGGTAAVEGVAVVTSGLAQTSGTASCLGSVTYTTVGTANETVVWVSGNGQVCWMPMYGVDRA